MKKVLLAILFVLMCFGPAVAETDVNLEWTPPATNSDGSPATSIAGYIIYYGNASGVYSNSNDVGNVTTYIVPALPDGVYYFAVSAYNANGAEGERSPECSQNIDTLDPNAPTGLQCSF